VSDEIARRRERLATRVVSATLVSDDRIAAALREVPRHLFLPHLPPESAYRDEAIVTKRDDAGLPISSSSQPAIMAIMLDQLALAPGLRVLEIGAGTGYNAALMQHIVGPSGAVVSIDIDTDVASQAREHLARAGYPDVTVVTADGAEGYPQAAPYDRVIATVGVSDLASSWRDQTGPGGRIVVPLDVRGTQLAVAFERAGDGAWTSVSLRPCGFMRMRGAQAGPERTVVLSPGLSVMLPDGLTLADGQDVDAEALAAYLADPPVRLATGVRTRSRFGFSWLALWLATKDLRSCAMTQERPGPGGPGAFRLVRAPVRHRGVRFTAGIIDSGGLAVLTAVPANPKTPATPEPSQGSAPRTLEVTGFGPRAPELAAALAAHVQAWDEAGQPDADGLRIDAYPHNQVAGAAHDRPLIERPSMKFAVYHA
jgi:protein-L-isoaspartate(D-aspartate) O-methyltransferase